MAPPFGSLQGYLRAAAARTHEMVSVPPFELFFHPSDALRFYNYAIPDSPIVTVDAVAIGLLRAEFSRRGRRVRFEFIEEYAPRLGSALAACGLPEEERHPLMVCTRETYQTAPVVEGLHIQQLTSESDNAVLRAFITTQRSGFSEGPELEATEAEGEDLRRRLRSGNRSFLACLNGIPVGTGTFTGPLDGFTELVGIATIEDYRGRGIATGLTGVMVQSALAVGVDTVFLSAEDTRAGRVYERVGFRIFGTSLVHGE